MEMEGMPEIIVGSGIFSGTCKMFFWTYSTCKPLQGQGSSQEDEKCSKGLTEHAGNHCRVRKYLRSMKNVLSDLQEITAASRIMP